MLLFHFCFHLKSVMKPFCPASMTAGGPVIAPISQLRVRGVHFHGAGKAGVGPGAWAIGFYTLPVMPLLSPTQMVYK